MDLINKAIEFYMAILFALNMLRNIPLGQTMEVDTPDVEISYKGHHWVITSITVEKRT